MKTIKKSTLLLFMTLLGSLTLLHAQTYTISDVGRGSARNMGTIMEGNIVKGYYYFYVSDKADKKHYNYEVVVLDAELNEIASETVVESKHTYLLESSYNGTKIMFKFFDSKLKKVYYRTMDNKGSLSEKETRVANKNELMLYTSSVQKQLKNTNLNVFGKNGFVDIYTYKAKKYSYKVEFLDNDGYVQWTHAPVNLKGVLGGAFLAANDEQVLILQGRTKSAMSRDAKYSILSLDADGAENFELEMTSSRYNLMPYNAFFNAKDGNIIILGQYYDISDKAMKSKSKGIFVKVVSKMGDEVSEKYISWSRDIKQFVPAEKKKEVANYSIYFHDMQLTKDGKIIVVGEQYRKQVSAAGTAFKALGAMSGGASNASAFEIKIGDMFIITLGSTYELDDVDILEKKPNRVTLEAGYGLANQHILAKVLDAYGHFDFSFTQTNEDNSLVSVAYIDLEKKANKGGKNLVLNVVSFSSGDAEPTKDKLILASKATSSRVSAGKPGHVVILEYFKKLKKIEFRLEPLNY